jgi:hypothetical protein
MAIEFRKNIAVFSDVVSVEEAEALLEWLQKKPSAGVDLAACIHLHPANLQVLMAAGATVKAWPANAVLAAWIKSALTPQPHQQVI